VERSEGEIERNREIDKNRGEIESREEEGRESREEGERYIYFKEKFG
jgi:hypothetical protein